MELQTIRQKIYEIRGQKVMLDFDLAELYGEETKALNQAVKRNIGRFPEDFMFRLTEEEWMRSQFVIASGKGNQSQNENSSEAESEVIDNQLNENSSQFVMSSDRGMRSQFVTASQKSEIWELPPMLSRSTGCRCWRVYCGVKRPCR